MFFRFGRDLEDRLVGGCALVGELAHLGLVGLTVGESPGEDGRVGGDTADVARDDEIGQVAGQDALAREVVEPDAHALGDEVGGGGAHEFSLCLSAAAPAAAIESRAAWATASAVMPNFWNRVL